jgi:hypothetical protein
MNFTLINGSISSYIANYSSIIYSVNETNMISYFISKPTLFSHISKLENLTL